MDTEFALALTNPQFMYVVIYDHAFSSTDWKNLIDSYGDRKGEKVLIITRAINKTVVNSDIPKYEPRTLLKKKFKFEQNVFSDIIAFHQVSIVSIKF